MSILDLTKDNFKSEVLDSKNTILVIFKAEWCPYCQRLKPVIKDLSESYQGKFTMGTVDEDVSEEIEDQYGVEIIPTLILFKNGIPGKPIVNPGTLENIKKWLKDQGIE